MFLGTPRRWWLGAAVPLVLGFALLLTGDGTVLRTTVAILLLIVAMVLFGMAPMRYGRSAGAPVERAVETPPAPSTIPTAAVETPRTRPAIEGRDAAEV